MHWDLRFYALFLDTFSQFLCCSISIIQLHKVQKLWSKNYCLHLHILCVVVRRKWLLSRRVGAIDNDESAVNGFSIGSRVRSADGSTICSIASADDHKSAVHGCGILPKSRSADVIIIYGFATTDNKQSAALENVHDGDQSAVGRAKAVITQLIFTASPISATRKDHHCKICFCKSIRTNFRVSCCQVTASLLRSITVQVSNCQ